MVVLVCHSLKADLTNDHSGDERRSGENPTPVTQHLLPVSPSSISSPPFSTLMAALRRASFLPSIRPASQVPTSLSQTPTAPSLRDGAVGALYGVPLAKAALWCNQS